MEATALSVGKAVLDGAVGYAKSFLDEEIALHLGVQSNTVFIKDELETMQSFLMDADEEQDKHRVLLTWVKQVRETAYNVEDNLMDFAHHSEKKARSWCCIPRILMERRSIAKEVMELRSMVADVSNRKKRYSLTTISGSKQATAVEEQDNGDSAAAILAINEASRAAVGLGNSKVDLCQLITNGDADFRVVAVWGAGGDLGKISTIRQAYEHHMVYEKFGCRAWVTLTNPFHLSEFFLSLLRQFYAYSREIAAKRPQGEVAGYDVLNLLDTEQSPYVDQVSSFVRNRRYLIVVDGLTTIGEWDWIKTYFPDKKNGSRVIVSTQQVEVAKFCLPRQPYQVTELQQLSSDQSIYIFHNEVAQPWSMKKFIGPSCSSAILDVTQRQFAPHGVGLGRKQVGPRPSSSNEIKEGTQPQISNVGHSRTLVAINEELVGRMNEKQYIINLIGQAHNGHNRKVISLWGMGGLGKTTLIRSVYQEQQLGGWKCAWVTAPRPFNYETILRNLVMHLEKDVEKYPATRPVKKKEKKAATAIGLQELIAKIRHLVTHECLVVIDDLSNIEDWNLIEQNLANAGCVIVTTREKFVAMRCSREDKNIYNLQRLPYTAAFELFKKKVFKDNTEKEDLSPDMTEQARLIINKCDGLPLAISAIGGFLAIKPKTAKEWRKTYNRINTELEINQELGAIKTVLLRSYEGLPYHLKSCFLYLSIFPENHKISRKRVIRRWVAEGYARGKNNISAEEVGDDYFDELLERSMILPKQKGDTYTGKIHFYCQLHDIMHQICISKAREENLTFTIEDEYILSSTQGIIRHLAIKSNWKGDENEFQRILDLSHVRSLTVFGEWKSFFISRKMKFLRVLDLEGAQGLEDHHLKKIGDLIHLKYLSLKGCGDITQLPKSVGSLRDLQTLNIRGTQVLILPPCITNLKKLQFLCGDRVWVPRGIGKLNALLTLSNVVVYKTENGCIKEFTNLYHLREIGIDRITKTNSKEFWSAINGLNHLLSMCVNWYSPGYNRMDYSLHRGLLPPRSIESLKVGGNLVRARKWIHQLQNLSKILLQYTRLQDCDIQAIGKLANLRILGMRTHSFEGKELIFKEAGSFPSLVLLEVFFVCPVASVQFDDGTMSKLELLRIKGWRELKELSGVGFLAKLKEIQLDLRCNEQFKDDVDNQLVGHPSNVQVIRKRR